MTSALEIRADSWAQQWSIQQNVVGLVFSLEILSELYDKNWLAQRVVDKLPEEGMRPKWRIKEDDGAIRKSFDALNVSPWQPEGHFLDALKKGRLHGGSAIILGYDSEPWLPAPEIGRGQVRWIDIARRDDLVQVAVEDDANSPNFGQTSLFELTGYHKRRGMRVHASRLVFCEGKTYQSRFLFTYSQGYRFPWISVLQPVNTLINDFGLSWESIAHLIREMSVMWVKWRGFAEAVASDDAQDLETRLRIFSMYKSIHKTNFLDAGSKDIPAEEVGRTSVSFADMASLMAEWGKLVAAAADMPVTVLMGISPAGMNATGESDLTLWYDRVRAYEDRSLRPKLETICSAIAGRPVEVAFDPIWEPTATEAADIRVKNATADKTYYDMGAIEGLEVAISRSEDDTLGLDIDVDEKREELKAQKAAAKNAPAIIPAITSTTAPVNGTAPTASAGGIPELDQPLDEGIPGRSTPGARSSSDSA